MYLCLCRGVNDRKVRHAIARGARSIEEISDRCGAGTGCGGCWPLLEDLLRAAGHDPDLLAAAGAHPPGRAAGVA